MRWLGGAVLAVILALGGCASPAPTGGPPVPREGGEVSVRGCTPSRPLIPGDTVDSCGIRLLDPVNARLVRYDPETGRPQLDLAKEISTTDNQLFTIRVQPGRRFHDGTEIKAENFVRAWNWNAYAPNRMSGASFFSFIDGYAATGCPGSGRCSLTDRVPHLTGLHVVDEHTFTVRTTAPVRDLAERVGHVVSAPYPDAFFAPGSDRDKFGRLPVGSGPFKIVSRNATDVVMERSSEYAGPARPHLDRVTFRAYDDPAKGADATKAYRDVVGGSLDFTDVIPTDELTDDQWKNELRARWLQHDTRQVEALTFVPQDQQLRDPRIRRAISRAFDRQLLTRQVFSNTRVPATSWVSAAVPDYRTDACGAMCVSAPASARQEFEQAGGYTGEFVITVNGDGGHKQWADAMCNQLKNNLQLACQVNVVANQALLRKELESGHLTGLVHQDSTNLSVSARSDLTAYTRGASGEGGLYDPAFEDKLTAASAADDQAGANTAYHDAEQVLAQDPPAIPLWYASTPVGWSQRVRNVRLTPVGMLDLSALWVE